MTAEEMKAAESGAQPAPLRIEGVDISPKRDEGVLKVRAGGAGTRGRRGPPSPEAPLAAALPPRLAAPRLAPGTGRRARPPLQPLPGAGRGAAVQPPAGCNAFPDWAVQLGSRGLRRGCLGARASPGPP